MAPLPIDAESVLLIVENFDNIRAALTSHFASAGYDLFSSATLSDALELACQNVPDVVIIDYELQGGGALAALQTLRRCLPNSYIVLIAPSESNIHAQAFRNGASKVIPKSERITELEDIAAPRCVYPRKHVKPEPAATFPPASARAWNKRAA